MPGIKRPKFSLYPRTRREWAISIATVPAILLLLVPLGIVGAKYMGTMPGKSWRGPLPEMTAAERDLSARLRGHVEMLAGTIGPRSVPRPKALEAAAVYIEEQFKQAGLAVNAQKFDCNGTQVRNIIAERVGASRPEEIVVVGAHYDSVEIPGGCPAANDNGSGDAAMLELARTIAAGTAPARTLRFVAFVNEEPPYFETNQMGSLVYARACRARGDKIVAMLSLETMACYSDVPGSQRYPTPFKLIFPSEGNFIGFVGDMGARALVRRAVGSFRSHAQMPSEGVAAPKSLEGVMWSDHWSFRQCGYPGIMVTDTAPFRYVFYHTPSDTPDKLDYDRLARVTEGLAPTILDLAGGAGPGR